MKFHHCWSPLGKSTIAPTDQKRPATLLASPKRPISRSSEQKRNNAGQ